MPTKLSLPILVALLLSLLLAGSPQAQEGSQKKIDFKDYELTPVDYTAAGTASLPAGVVNRTGVPASLGELKTNLTAHQEPIASLGELLTATIPMVTLPRPTRSNT